MYVTLEECTTYLSTELWAEAWLTTSTHNQQLALNKSEKIVDAIRYYGEKLDKNQIHEFPRDYQETIPQDVKDAVCLIALKLVEGRIPELDSDMARIKSDNLASAKTTYNEFNTPKHVLYGVPSYDAWGMLIKYVDTHKGIALNRVN